MNSTVVTIFEGDYHRGLSALANSLYKHGFRGHIYAGYRGLLPPWVAPSKSQSDYAEHQVCEDLFIRFVLLNTDWHLTNFKPSLMTDIALKYETDSKAIFFFDPDIVVKCNWTVFEQWAQGGIALCQDIVTENMSTDHPLRHEWRSWAKEADWVEKQSQNRYYNGGFIGVSKEHFSFLTLWKQMMEKLGRERDLSRFMPEKRPYMFHGTDQDVLNIATMCTDLPLSVIGPEGMDFIGGGYTMSHAVGSPKPWKRDHLKEFLNGHPPKLADRCYWDYADGPISLYSTSRIRREKILMKIASFLARFYKK